MRVIQLHNPFPNGFGDNDIERATVVVEEYQAVYDAIVAGTACVRFIDGDRKGAIARLRIDEGYTSERPCLEPHWDRWDRNIKQKLANYYIWCVATWDGRKNRTKVSVPNDEIEILLDYEGPTVWELFDAKAAKEQILKNPNQVDINGNLLVIGAPVLYINARYGSRMTLEEGTVVEFVVSANSRGHSISTVIESKTGELSSLQYPESMVYLMGQ